MNWRRIVMPWSKQGDRAKAQEQRLQEELERSTRAKDESERVVREAYQAMNDRMNKRNRGTP